MDLATFGIEDLSDEDVALRFSIPTSTLKTMLDKTSVVVSGKDFVPVLMNFCIQAAPSSVRVLTSSLDIAMLVSSKDATVTIPGRAFFPARRLAEIVSSAPDGDLHLEVRGSAAKGLTGRIEARSAVTGARTTWALNLHSGIGYPALPSLGDLQMRQVPRMAFCEALKAVGYAAAGQGSAGAANAALAQVSFEHGQVLACDGSRLARARFVCDTLPEPFTLPIGAVDDVLRLLGHERGDSESTFLMGQTATHIVVQYSSDALVISRSAQDFPDTASFVILPKAAVRISLATSDVLAALKQVKTSLDTEAPLIGMRISSNGVGIYSQDKYGNKSLTELPVKVLVPNDITLMFSYRYLLQLIQKFPDADLILMFDPKLKNKQTVFFVSKDESALSVLPQAVAF